MCFVHLWKEGAKKQLLFFFNLHWWLRAPTIVALDLPPRSLFNSLPKKWQNTENTDKKVLKSPSSSDSFLSDLGAAAQAVASSSRRQGKQATILVITAKKAFSTTIKKSLLRCAILLDHAVDSAAWRRPPAGQPRGRQRWLPGLQLRRILHRRKLPWNAALWCIRSKHT